MRILARQTALSHSDWSNLVEERRFLIEPHLRVMDLTPIGQLRMVQYDRSLTTNTLEDDNPELIANPANLTLKTRCLYARGEGFYSDKIPLTSCDHIFDPPGSCPAVGAVERFWALSRSGTWLAVEVTCQFPKDQNKARVIKVIIRQRTFADLLSEVKTTPKEIWLQLGLAVRDWHRRREHLLSQSRVLAELFSFEEQVSNFNCK